jgi:predicted acylesterase/phospholipase RssA
MTEQRPRRSLIMAGGGIKVAFQAGVLQVWLDEVEGVEFDHADGASGGVLNLAMWCQGRSGTEIADNWRGFAPMRGFQPNWLGWLLGPFAPSLFRLERFRKNVFSAWGLDWEAIRSTAREATFNLYNFSRHEHLVLTPDRMTADRLISAISLPLWFPPVVINGDVYIDAVFATDANLEEAIRRGADELWIIWTVSQRGAWHHGFAAHYFQIIEACANSRLRDGLRRIQANNAAIERGETGEFGRPITVQCLDAEVPVRYLLNFTRDRIAAGVDLGVAVARSWCDERGIPRRAVADTSSPAGAASVRFTEQMRGFIAFGEDDFEQGARNGRASEVRLSFRLTITIDDIERFMHDPEREAAATGSISCEELGGRREVERGTFNLFVDTSGGSKRMRYRLMFRDAAGQPLTLTGFKVVRDDPGVDVWADTTTLYTRILQGHVSADADDRAGVVAAGMLRIHPLAFARQLTTFRSSAPSVSRSAQALLRFLRLFLGHLWDVYAYAPLRPQRRRPPAAH